MNFQLLSVLLLMLATRCVYSVAVGHQPGEDHDHDHDHENDDHDQGEVNDKDHESALTNIEEKLEDKMTLNSLNILLENLNEECLTADSLFESFGTNLDADLRQEQVYDVYAIVAYYLQTSESFKCNNSKSLVSASTARETLFMNGTICAGQLTKLIESISANRRISQSATSSKCYGISSIVAQCTSDPDEINQALAKIVVALADGVCLLPGVSYFQDILLAEFVSAESQVVSEEDFGRFLAQLRIGEIPSSDGHDGHDHGEDEDNHDMDNDHEDHDHETDPDREEDRDHEDHDHDMNNNRGDHDHGVDENHEEESDHEDHDHGVDANHEEESDHEDHDHGVNANHEEESDHEDHDHGVNTNHEEESDHVDHDHGVDENHEEESDHEDHDHEEHEDHDSHNEDDNNVEHNNANDTSDGDLGNGVDPDHDHEDEHETDNKPVEAEMPPTRTRRNADDAAVRSKCLSSSEMKAIAMSERTANKSENQLMVNDIIALYPVFLQQIASGACQELDGSHVTRRQDITYTTAQKYGYGTLAVLVISLLAFGGLLLFPSIGSVGYQLTMQFFIALGVGSLSGDALLHLIPEVLGLHGHEEGDSHDHGEEEEDKTYIYRLLVVIGGIYLFFLFENVLRLWNQLRGTKVTFHHHDDDGHAHMEEGKKRGEHHGVVRTLSLDKVDEHPDGKKKPSKHMDSVGSENILSEGRQTVCCGITPVGVMVLIGDILHNFGDGLALGVAFSSSWFGGLGASIAIFCHELPHEFGDFAIYLKNGMSKWKALGLNFLAACFAFVGLYIGLSVAENSEVRQWLLAVIAGMFLYISLVDVLHEMIEEKSEKHPILQFFLQNLGICLGWAILFLLALYEDQIRSSINA